MINKIRKNHPKGVRHEIKILLSYGEYLSFSSKLKAVVSPDRYSMDNGDYFIRLLTPQRLRQQITEKNTASAAITFQRMLLNLNVKTNTRTVYIKSHFPLHMNNILCLWRKNMIFLPA